ncbi:helix-turn-helix domain-containing protein [Streptomyces rimosus]|uniref:helix-turn-helix domain-containing protein n=1 Tax=Streptomyces rimosus TaxID=1927 RepID=UPI00067BC7F0|nr:helix-turn-helix domain-containing protein [Streptomyces rimosus]
MQNPPGETFARGPWHELPTSFGSLLRPRIDAIASDMVEAIRDEVPAYRRPLDSSMGRDLVDSVCRAMRQFAELTEAPESTQDHHVRHFRHLGRVEFLNGRTTDGLQAAFRVGARVGSRRYAEIARTASLPTEIVLPLHEAVLTHINALSNEAVRGFVAAQARAEGEVQRSRRALAQALLEQPRGTPREPLEALAARARWPLPRRVACLVVRDAAGSRFTVPGLGQEALALSRGADLVVVLPEPGDGGPAGIEDVRSAVRGRTAALGPAVAPRDAWVSLVCVRLALNHQRDTGAPDGGLLIVGDRLADVHLLGGAHIGRLLADRALGALDGLPAGRAARLAETLDALLMSWGRSAPEVAQALGIHPQTARKRLRQLDALFDGRLADPDFRFAALLALRTRALGR